MRRTLLLAVVSFSSVVLSGCLTTPAPEEQAYSAYVVGDRSRVALDEIVVSLPLKGASEPYQNLHVSLAAAINPVKTTAHSPYTVADILQRLEARISARLVEQLCGSKEQTLQSMPELRAGIAHQAQEVVDEAMRQWKHGADYEVRILVISLYWTDASVGRAGTPRRGWW